MRISQQEWRGLQKGTKPRAKYTYHEEQEIEALFAWAGFATGEYPLLSRLFRIPNEGLRHSVRGKQAPHAGIKKGIPDLCLPVPNEYYHGLYVEMKAKTGTLTSEQEEWLLYFANAGYKSCVAYGWESARDTIVTYLQEVRIPN